MSRPRLTIGTFGEISVQRTPGGKPEACARYRDWDGKTRLIQATCDSLKGTDRALRSKLADRALPSVVIFDTRSGQFVR